MKIRYSDKGANVVIQKTDSSGNEHACSCGRSLTLTCTLEEQKFAVAWMNANDITPIAQCVKQSCKLNPAYLGQYTFSSDADRNIFNLTIIKVTKKDDGRKLVCSDGSNIDSIILRVIDYEPQLFEDTKNGTIMAMSGCVSQNRNVTFKWILVDVDSQLEKVIQPQILDANMTSCLNNSDCTHNDKVQYTETIYARASNYGNCYVKVAAFYGNERKETPNTAVKYLFEEQDNKSSNGPNSAIVAGAVIGVIGFVFAILICFYKRHKTK
ncbi:uncharacterized protein LOC132737581 isoform X2 [Ruditapes philippinarum]|uniref:uncharacterized protein LOC132737581 isoform X2 n=1 Tax=Ruditapes philippinarum TaxID=129788 RepID=UPI00295B07CC|nr:uncharacterized protein LOC132737581 isoform X2 [Ruditapes philippinarum]XP_060580869.1 uncharacterized protein LOC132737581 isoform X2 [Ruditapes philippinarum]XP_060580870.1 uncharacterized protein LOC132737581 isoform X2 [Ruditapes philippinarum]XP_060580871.1 uncharacterized protein LOC132737581 isoform X2 [Ruditapes philippinarum]XP_060580872.1 uncharacterized protein LOC132737581 isoform X2 [Ruditapes philippinarum]XP_060580873.1 uncharacterized protein LOC132737581 isoform X2 [Rudita